MSAALWPRMKLNQMIEDGTITAEAAKIGYVGRVPLRLRLSPANTSFFLGARSVCPSATMEVALHQQLVRHGPGKGDRRGPDRRWLRAHFPAFR